LILSWLYLISFSSSLASIKTNYHLSCRLSSPFNRYHSPSSIIFCYQCSLQLNSTNFTIKAQPSFHSFFLRTNSRHKIEWSYHEKLRQLFFGRMIRTMIKLGNFITLNAVLKLVVIYLAWFLFLSENRPLSQQQ